MPSKRKLKIDPFASKVTASEIAKVREILPFESDAVCRAVILWQKSNGYDKPKRNIEVNYAKQE